MVTKVVGSCHISSGEAREGGKTFWLGNMAYMKGAEKEALEEFVTALQLNRHLLDYLGIFQSLLQKQGISAADQIELLNGLYSGKEDMLFLAHSLTPRAGQVWLYYRKKVGLPVDEAASFLVGGHVSAAAMVAARQLSASRKVRQWAAT